MISISRILLPSALALCLTGNLVAETGHPESTPTQPVILTPPAPETPRVNGPAIFGVRPALMMRRPAAAEKQSAAKEKSLGGRHHILTPWITVNASNRYTSPRNRAGI
ncbi:MAG: hypothetical protein JF599_11605 [Verrucomicrobia bacterium]|nr:hypothetical protein [Verrucomicrobiota bacterium]